MDANHKQPKTLQEAIRYFGNPDNVLAYMIRLRWPDGVVTCPACGRDRRCIPQEPAQVAVQEHPSQAPVFRQGWHRYGRLSDSCGQVAYRRMDDGELLETV